MATRILGGAELPAEAAEAALAAARELLAARGWTKLGEVASAPWALEGIAGEITARVAVAVSDELGLSAEEVERVRRDPYCVLVRVDDPGGAATATIVSPWRLPG
jgi:hypothetical protein